MQQALRDAPVDQFPLATEFQQSKAMNTLISPKICGHFLAGILLDSTKDEFTQKEWNIYTDYKANPIPAPFNKDKLAVNNEKALSLQ
ncbi:MAG TPA: hypothetical protein VKR58_07170, partial [Aquella sp.]|nr:hypothetical protein [Aquella sp.]